MDIKAFKSTMYALATLHRMRIGAIHEPRVTPNFFVAECEKEDGKFYVLCSLEDNWALSRIYEQGSFQLDFFDIPDLSNSLEFLTGKALCIVKELNSPFVAQSDMNQHDIDYWKPQTLGEALFNWWD